MGEKMALKENEKLVSIFENEQQSLNSPMQLIHGFDVPRRRAFQGWAGPISSWPEHAPPKVKFGIWKLIDPTVGIVTFECKPFQLCMFGANTKAMSPRDKFTYFAFAGLDSGGKLRLTRLPEGNDARAIFEAGGWSPPSIEEMVNSVTLAANLEIDEMDKAFQKLMLDCTNGFGISYGLRPNEVHFLNVLAGWPMLGPLNAAFLALKEKRALIRAQIRTASANLRKDRLEKVLESLNASNNAITAENVASNWLGIPLASDGIVPRVKEKAKKLKKEFGDHFPELAI